MSYSSFTGTGNVAGNVTERFANVIAGAANVAGLSLGVGVTTLSGTGNTIAPVIILANSVLSGTTLIETAGRGISTYLA